MGDSVVMSSSKARNIGVTFDQHLSMVNHISSICKSSYVQIRNLAKIKKFVDRSSLEHLVHAFITSRLDFCNSLLCGLPSAQIQRLQRIQNIAARLLTGCSKFEHITPILRELHWLPVEQRIKFKVLLLVWKSVNESAPAYLQELVQPYVPTRSLRSSIQGQLMVPYTRSTCAQSRAFSIAGPTLWNVLPCELKSIPSLNTFKSKLKTYLFQQYFIT